MTTEPLVPYRPSAAAAPTRRRLARPGLGYLAAGGGSLAIWVILLSALLGRGG